MLKVAASPAAGREAPPCGSPKPLPGSWVRSLRMCAEKMARSREEKGGEKKGRPAILEVVTREYTINVHKRIRGAGFKKCASLHSEKSGNLP
ncbi:hypothetical protein CB1_001508018 [Camelus ferus]|nr:hypothetical protein CB1_001508018 [Camelus ferus]